MWPLSFFGALLKGSVFFWGGASDSGDQEDLGPRRLGSLPAQSFRLTLPSFGLMMTSIPLISPRPRLQLVSPRPGRDYFLYNPAGYDPSLGDTRNIGGIAAHCCGIFSCTNPPVWPVGGVVVAVTAFLVFIHHIIVFHGFSLFFDVFN